MVSQEKKDEKEKKEGGEEDKKESEATGGGGRGRQRQIQIEGAKVYAVEVKVAGRSQGKNNRGGEALYAALPRSDQRYLADVCS